MKQTAISPAAKFSALVLLCGVLAGGCAAPDSGSPPAPSTAPAAESSTAAPVSTASSESPSATIVEEAPSPATPAPPLPGADQNIFVDAVEAGNPLVIRGRARTFENNVALRVRDARGAIIGESFTTAEGEMGQHSRYTGRVWVTRDPGGRITGEALEYSAKDGSERSVVAKTIPYSVETVEARLFFPDKSCTGVKPYSRRIPKSVSMARLLVEALMAGPIAAEKASGASGPFPSGSAVRSVNLKNGVLTVDFNERLQNVGGACAAQMIRASVIRTLEALPSVSKVVITAGGSESLALQP